MTEKRDYSKKDSSTNKSGIYALLNNENTMEIPQNYQRQLNVPSEARPQFSKIAPSTLLHSSSTNDISYRLPQFPIAGTRDGASELNSLYPNQSTNSNTPVSNLSAPTGANGTTTPYSVKFLDPLLRDELGGSPIVRIENPQEKRQRRLIRNRVAAQDSRLKKKLYVSGLEEKVKYLESENYRLHKDIMELNEQLNSGKILDDLTGSGSDSGPIRTYYLPKHLLPPRPASTPPILSNQNISYNPRQNT